MKLVFILIFIFQSLISNAIANDAKPNTGKDMCLLENNYCKNQSYYNIVEKIARIKAALAIGANLYTEKEIEHLEYLYEEALFTCDRIECQPSHVPEMSDRLNN